MTMLCTMIRGQMSYTFFQLGGTCPPMSISWVGRCHHMPFFIGGGGAHVRGGEMSYTRRILPLEHSAILLTCIKR